jgi:hypothetical protein
MILSKEEIVISLRSKEIIESQKSYYQEAVKEREEFLRNQGLATADFNV